MRLGDPLDIYMMILLVVLMCVVDENDDKELVFCFDVCNCFLSLSWR